MKRLFVLLLSAVPLLAGAAEWIDQKEISVLFKHAGVEGTFVVYDHSREQFLGHNPVRANARFIPASTFKIPNSLIGLSVGAVANVDEVLPYGGQPQPFPQWEKDMGLVDAIKVSNVPVYKELARRIGLERMKNHVKLLEYGNQEIGATVDNFWLAGPLKISAIEQVQFLSRLTRDALPLKKNIQKTVRDLVQLERGDNWTLYGKTGWADAPDPDIGWLVGWVENEKQVYPFALNIDMPNKEDRKKRMTLVKDSLTILQIIQEPADAAIAVKQKD